MIWTLCLLFIKTQGEIIYGNYGRTSDFEELVKMGVNLTGKIMLFRYGKTARSRKVMQLSIDFNLVIEYTNIFFLEFCKMLGYLFIDFNGNWFLEFI